MWRARHHHHFLTSIPRRIARLPRLTVKYLERIHLVRLLVGEPVPFVLEFADTRMERHHVGDLGVGNEADAVGVREVEGVVGWEWLG